MTVPGVNKILIALTVLFVLILAMLLYRQIWERDNSYYAVMTLGGDLFFGELHYFPSIRLTNVWTLQRNPQDEKNPLSLAKFDRSVWGPEDVVYLNKKNIIWKTKLKADSQVLLQMKNPPGPQLQQQPQPQQQPSENIINN